MAPCYLGDFKLNGKALRKRGVNRIGNLIIPNKNYCHFDDWLMPILNTMTDEQERCYYLSIYPFIDPSIHLTMTTLTDRLVLIPTHHPCPLLFSLPSLTLTTLVCFPSISSVFSL